jgi:hypothetical protein
MVDKTIINLGTIAINTIGKECDLSLSSSFKIKKNVSNKKMQGFGEQNADGVIIIDSYFSIDDSDIIDSPAFKK